MNWIVRPPAFYRLLLRGGIFRMPGRTMEGDKVVYLTFDDGPVPGVTPGVLDVLDIYGIKATFFMVADNARRWPELLEDVRRRGHMIGNHTFHHLQGGKVARFRYLRDILEADRLLHTPLFRPPHGWLRPGQARALRSRFRIIMHDLVSCDFDRRLTPGQVIGNVLRYVRPGSIIVFHDSQKAWPRLELSLEATIEKLLERGFVFQTFDSENG